MILIDLKTRREYNILLKKSGGEEALVCPLCSDDRKKKTIKCFSFNHNKQVGRCNHCNETLVVKREYEVKKEYKKPVWKNRTELSDNVIKWFEGRGLTQETIRHFKISEGPEWMPQIEKEVNTIQFPYFRNNEIVNIKWRDGKKNFKVSAGSELIFFNLDSIRDTEEVIICEGELDCLAIHQAGYKYVVSVPNGATLGKINLDYLDNCIEYFHNKTSILLATDNDTTGRNLQDQLSERLGKERCYKVTFKDCKDANDCLKKYGIQGIIESIADKKEYPLEGVSTIQDYSDDINDMYERGLPKGARTNLKNLNKLITFHKGYITTITGIPNQGKTSALDQIVLDLSLTANWKGAFYSPENKPTSLHISNLAKKLIGRPWWGDNRISRQEIELVKSYLNERFFFIKPEQDFTLDSILNHTRRLVMSKGIDFLVIDAWNRLEHKYTNDENRYIGESLDKLSNFCEYYNIHLFLVAHPRKMLKKKGSDKYEVPNLYDISGSANFFNKTDNGICIYRDYEDDISRWFVQKVKFAHWGSTGYCEFKYEVGTGRFNEYYGGVPTYNNTPWIHSGIKEPENIGIILDDGSPNPLD